MLPSVAVPGRSLALLCAAAVAACADRTTAPHADPPGAVLAAEVDGVPWVPVPDRVFAEFDPALGHPSLTVDALRCLHCALSGAALNGQPGDTLEWLLVGVPAISGLGTYAVLDAAPPGSSPGFAVLYRMVRASDSSDTFFSLSKSRMFVGATGQVVVTTFDPIGRHVAGSFAFNATDSLGATIEVRKGVFDLPISSNVPQLSFLQFKWHF